MMKSAVFASLFLPFVCISAAPAPKPQEQPGGGQIPNILTLTAVKAGDDTYNGLKVNYGGGFNLFQEKVSQYCPTVVQQCPNGTETVLSSGLGPICQVPGGQQSYIQADGLFRMTVQHSAFMPPGSVLPYDFHWTAPTPGSAPPCATADAKYNCEPPSGILKWGQDADSSKIFACPNGSSSIATSIFIGVPGFVARDGCVELDGLGTHDYAGKGPIPPVWTYL